MDEILSAISTVGFPIAMCLLLWWDKAHSIASMTDALNKLTTNIESNSALLSAIINSINKED